MKKVLFLAVLFMTSLFADDIPEGMHMASREVTLSKADFLTDKTIVACGDGPIWTEDYHCFVIENNASLHAGYKFNYLYLFAVNVAYLQEHVETYFSDNYKWIQSADIDFLALAVQNNVSVFPGGTSIEVDDIYPVTKDQRFYEVTASNENNVTVTLKKRIVSFSNGASDKVIDY